MEHNRSTIPEVIDDETKVITAYLSRIGKKGGSTGHGTAKSKAKTRKMLEGGWGKKDTNRRDR
jgi:hypothetical protein